MTWAIYPVEGVLAVAFIFAWGKFVFGVILPWFFGDDIHEGRKR